METDTATSDTDIDSYPRENWETRFIKPCRYSFEAHRPLTSSYIMAALAVNKIVQINLDNCTIQRMEALPDAPTIQDATREGLLPLVNILQTSPYISLTCMGIREMPDWRVANANLAYQNFCRKFWPDHRDDLLATHRKFDPTKKDKKVKFQELSDNAKITYGVAYISMLQIKNIKLSYKNHSHYDQFIIYLHSMTNLLDFVSAFELEIAKYAFWNLSMRQINGLPETIKRRLSDMKKNFFPVKSDITKCKELAFSAAMDISWLSTTNLSEDLESSLEIDGRKFTLDSWVGTNDHKLYRICQDLHWAPYDGSNSKAIFVTREDYLDRHPYWLQVDSLSQSVMYNRQNSGYNEITEADFLSKINSAVTHIENEIKNTTKTEEKSE